VSGKTGTAQFWRGGIKDNHTWFIAFAPYDEPRYAVSVIVQGAQSGGGVAAPIAAKILSDVFKMEEGAPVEVASLDPAKGSFQFVSSVDFGRAIPAGILIATATMAVFAIAQLDDAIDADEARSVAVLVAGSVALMNLYRVARPLNTLRLTLVTTMIVLFGAAFTMPWSRDLFELPLTELWVYGVAAAFIVAAYPLLVLGGRTVDHVRHRRGAVAIG
jgi:hypothetical protein